MSIPNSSNPSNSLPPSDHLLIEVFTEELPPKSLRRLGKAFSDGLHSALHAAGLLSQNSIVTSYATPRRLAVQITDVLSQAPDYPVREKLLPTSIAFDAKGLTPPLSNLTTLPSGSSAAAAPAAAVAKAPPKINDVVINGDKKFRFKGGDPNQQSNWVEVK